MQKLYEDEPPWWTFEEGQTDWKTCALAVLSMASQSTWKVKRSAREPDTEMDTEMDTKSMDQSKMSYKRVQSSQYPSFKKESIYHRQILCYGNMKDETTVCSDDTSEDCDIYYGGRFDSPEECEDHCRESDDPPCNSWVWYSENPPKTNKTKTTRLVHAVKGSCRFFSTIDTHREREENTYTGDCGKYYLCSI